MQKVGRFYPPDREVLKDISLSFFPGAKIGVLGNNGSGKSSLLSIMAGQDPDHDGEARLTDGFTVGLLEQEPVLNPEKNVLENVMEGVGEVASVVSTKYPSSASVHSVIPYADWYVPAEHGVWLPAPDVVVST